MELHKQLAAFPKHQKTVLTIGTFDGLHLGHQKILSTVCSQAKQEGLAAVLLTFHPHPRRVLFPDQPLGLIQTQEEKLSRLAALGLDHVVVLEFNAQLAQQTAAEFVEEVLIKGLNAQSIIIGYDHQFGHDRQGNLAFLRSYEAKGCFEVMEIPVEQIDEVYISSSKIRKAIAQGHIAQANAYLGQPYQVSGFVSRGLQNGRSIGYPTANVQLTEAEKILPADGVYAVSSEYNGTTLFGMMNIGWRPTIEEAKIERKIEVHFFDFQSDIYEVYLALSLHERIRPEQKFANLEALKAQLKKDELAVKTYFQTT
jgi:riboflavin kinase/FMN adenylyltransferase